MLSLLALAWRYLRPLLPYIASALVTLAILYGAYSWAYSRGSHSRDREVATITADRDNLKQSVAFLRADLDQQNAAVAQAKADADARVAAGQKALADAQAANAKQAGTIATLRKSANGTPHAPGDPCSLSPLAGKNKTI